MCDEPYPERTKLGEMRNKNSQKVPSQRKYCTRSPGPLNLKKCRLFHSRHANARRVAKLVAASERTALTACSPHARYANGKYEFFREIKVI